MGTYHAEDVRSGKLPDVLDKLLKLAHARCAFSIEVSFGARGWSSGSSGLIRSSTGATPFQILIQFVFQESRSLTSSSRCFLVLTFSTTLSF